MLGSVDPDQERDPVPAPTVIYFPQNDVYLQGQDDWRKSPPDLWHEFAHVQKPGDVLLSHITALNITQQTDVSVDDIVPRQPDHPSFVPPPEWLARRKSSVATQSTTSTTHLMDNGGKAPDPEHFSKLARELLYDTDDALRLIAHRKPLPGHEHPHLHHFREFWEHLDVMAQFWDSSLDNYSTTAKSAPPSPTQTRPKLMKLNFFSAEKSHTASSKAKKDKRPANAQTYSGRRIGTGNKMPEHYRVDMVRSLVRCVAHAFKCSLIVPRYAPKLQVKTMLIPVTHSGVVWQTPSDKHLAKQGFQEGPLLGIQCRNETGFMAASRTSVLDVARETAAMLQLAQDRSREGKPPVIPGQGQWWTTQRRWGGGAGGEFGEAEQKALEEKTTTTTKPEGPQRRASYPSYSPLPNGKTEEETWKELRPGKSLWQPRTIYRSVGKNEDAEVDSVSLRNMSIRVFTV